MFWKEVRENAEKYFGKLYNEPVLTMADGNKYSDLSHVGSKLHKLVQLQIVIRRGQFLFRIWITWSFSYRLVSTKLQ